MACCLSAADHLLAHFFVTHPGFNSRNEPFRCLPARGAIKVDGDNVGKAPFKPGKIGLYLCTTAVFGLPFRQRDFAKATCLLCNLAIVSSPSILEQSFYLIVG